MNKYLKIYTHDPEAVRPFFVEALKSPEEVVHRLEAGILSRIAGDDVDSVRALDPEALLVDLLCLVQARASAGSFMTASV